jgi:uncharacterized protein (TIGR02246 family)
MQPELGSKQMAVPTPGPGHESRTSTIDKPAAAQAGLASAAAEVPKRIVAAWAEHDADAFASAFSEDGSLILSGDVFLQSRDEIRSFMTAAFAGPFKGTRVSGQPVQFKHLGDDAALVITRGGVSPAGATEVPPDQEIRATWVLVRQGDEWLITNYQNTPIRAA